MKGFRTNSKILKIFLLAAIIILALLVLTGCETSTTDTSAYADSGDKIYESLNPNLDYLIVVNKDHPYEFGGDYDNALQESLVYVPEVDGEYTGLEKATYTAFLELQKYLADEGVIIGLYNGYRTEDDQKWVYDYYGNLEGWCETNTVAKPGYSEHHTGLLANIVIWYKGEEDENPTWYTETAERQQEIPYFQIVHQVLADFGFIDRYPAGKESITGVSAEPYEIRFVGSPTIAHEIMDNGFALEEYLSQNG